MSESKSKGREKAKENTFIKLQTRVEDYEPDNILRICDKTKNCQLCGQHIEYDFLLKHKTNPDKNLYVGSDCIITFCKTHLPNIIGMLLAKMEMQMKSLVEERKASVFAETNPTFKDDCEKLRKDIREKIMELKLYYELNSGKLKLPILETLDEALADYRSSRYTTKPKVEEIAFQLKEFQSGRLFQKFQDYLDNKSYNKTIADDLNEKNQSFYDEYLKYAKPMKWDKEQPTTQSKALSDLEKDIFLVNAIDYVAKRARNKKKLKKNKQEVFERIRKEISDSRLVFHRIEKDSHRFSYISDPKLKDDIAKYQVFFDRSKLRYVPNKIHEDVITYGLASLGGLFGKTVEHYAELGKAEDHYIYTNEYILFKDEHTATSFIENLRTIIENKLQEIESYLESDDIVTSDFH